MWRKKRKLIWTSPSLSRIYCNRAREKKPLCNVFTLNHSSLHSNFMLTMQCACIHFCRWIFNMLRSICLWLYPVHYGISLTNRVRLFHSFAHIPIFDPLSLSHTHTYIAIITKCKHSSWIVFVAIWSLLFVITFHGYVCIIKSRKNLLWIHF